MLAALLTQIQFIGDNNENIVLQADTLVLVDNVEGIGLFNGQYFDIFPFEYRLLA